MATGIRIPPQIPPPERNGYEDTYEETRSTVEMEIGAPRVRNKMRKAPRIVNVRWTLTSAAYKVFDIWFSETIKGGELPFDIRLLDDSEDLVWYTARWERGTYKAQIDVNDQWIVTGALRAVDDPFLTRPAGTDELSGAVTFDFAGQGRILIAKALSGFVEIGVTPVGRLIPAPMLGRTYPTMDNTGRLMPRPFIGIADMGMVNTGHLLEFGDPTLVLKFDAVAYTPDNGGTVALQFSADIYYPPHVV